MKSMPPHPFAPLRHSARRAFTLIELLVVVAIIAVLAGLILQTSGFVQEKAATSRAKTEMAALESALESYKIDNGAYPESADGKTKVLINELFPSVESRKKIYFEIPANMVDTQFKGDPSLATRLVDPFGNEYFYDFPGNVNRNGVAFFDLYSKGKKGNGNNAFPERWITNW